jgi:hypothetical protein
MKSWLRGRRWPPPKALYPARFATPLMYAMMRRHQWSPATAYLLLLAFLVLRMNGYRWVEAAASTESHRLRFAMKASSIVSPSSDGLVGDALGASSVTTRSAHAVSLSDASVIVVLVIESDSAMHAFPPLVLALRTLMLVLRMHVPLANRASLRLHSLVVPRRPGLGLRSCAARRRLQYRRQDPLQGVARSSMSTPVSTLAFSASLP